MSLSQPEVAMQKLCEQAMEFVSHQGLDPGAFRRLSPFNDWSRNQPFQLLESFPAALVALRELPHFDSRFGANSASNFALQFIFNFLGASTTARFDRAPFEKVWGDLISELAEPNWVYFSICNLANFTSPCDLLPIGDGIQIRSRNFAEISKLLGWTDQTIDATLGRDWDEGGVGNHVLISESRLPKHADNLALVNDVGSITKLDQILVAMRLLKPGFVCPGRIFFARKSIFRYGLGGRSSSGYSRWNPGSKYELLEADLSSLRSSFEWVKMLEGAGDSARSLNLALRAFNSIYARDNFRAEDRLVDCVTAIEAALRLDTDLSFRSSFQVAGLLADNDEERVQIFRDMKAFYDTRSKVVHGGTLKAKHVAILQDYEKLVDVVRRLLRGFVRATATNAIPMEFYEEIDVLLQHSVRRAGARAAFGWSS